MSASTVTTNAGIQMPKLIYGTAWKKERTTELVIRAVLNGFRGIDTACQPKHYREDLVGAALKELTTKHNVKREDLFIQTKFTSLNGQDPSKIPYDKNAPLEEQVRQSMKKSLENLQTKYIDSLVLHGPESTHEGTMKVWRVCEEFVKNGQVKQLGISNLYDKHGLEQLWNSSTVKPSVLQNRFYSDTDFDREIRKFCHEKNIYYQSFWTLTANPDFLKHSLVKQMAQQRHGTVEQILFRFLIDIGCTPLTGTTNDEHMKRDLEILTWPNFTHDEIAKLKPLIGEK